MTTAVVLLLLGILAILLIIAANGYFVAQEFSYMSVDRMKLKAMAKKGDPKAHLALKVTGRTSFMLSGAQLGITVTGLLVGYVAEPMIGNSLAILLGGTGIDPMVSISVGTVCALVAATVIQMIFGELYPKNMAIAAPEPLARSLARSTLIYLSLFGWLITIFDHASNALLRLLRITPVTDLDTAATPHDLEHIVADSRASGHLSEQLSLFLDRVLDFPQRTVEHAMIPRSQVGVVTPHIQLTELRRLMSTEHTRYPVVSDADEPLGMVRLKDLLRHPELPELTEAQAIMRPALLLPASMPLPEAVSQMSRRGNQLACVIDEYGGFAGVVSFEDLAEEVIGELGDEHDPSPVPTIHAVGKNRWRVSGQTHLDEVERSIGRPLPAGDYQTLSGLFIATHGQLPIPGERLHLQLPPTAGELLDSKGQRHVLDMQVIRVHRHVPHDLLITLRSGSGTTGGAP